MELREYQGSTLEKVRVAIRGGAKSILLVAPTGSGKTVMAAEFMTKASEKYRHSLFLAHRREIIHQTSDKLKAFQCPHGIILAGHRPSAMSRVQVGSIQSMHSRHVQGDRDMPMADIIVFDEAHRSLAVTYQEVRALYPDAILIGMTATPVRGDGKGLGSMYDAMVESVGVQELMDQGFLVPTRVFAPTMPDLSGVHTRAGDYIKSELEGVMDGQELVGHVVRDWEERASDRPTVVFASGVRHGKHLCEQFTASGYRAAHVDGKTAKEERDEILARVQDGDIQIIVNCDVLLEGWDCPPISCCVLARPTKSYGLYLQMAGRTLRPWEGKRDSIIIDHAGAVYNHGFVQDAGDWSLCPDTPIEKVKAEKEVDEPEPTTCRECFEVYTRSRSCPNCGCVPTTTSKQRNMAEGRLKEVKHKKVKKSDKQTIWNTCLYQCVHTNRKVGVAAHIYRKKVGVWPKGLDLLPAGKVQWNMSAKEFMSHATQRY
jgi:superfamily II DNA or RNA helicase